MFPRDESFNMIRRIDFWTLKAFSGRFEVGRSQFWFLKISYFDMHFTYFYGFVVSIADSISAQAVSIVKWAENKYMSLYSGPK